MTSFADATFRMPLTARPLHAGSARGRVLRLDKPLSFWGGTDLDGRIIDRHHPQCDESVAGTVLVMRSGRGSSSSSYVLTEQLRRGSGPVAIVLAEPDAIVTLGRSWPTSSMAPPFLWPWSTRRTWRPCGRAWR